MTAHNKQSRVHNLLGNYSFLKFCVYFNHLKLHQHATNLSANLDIRFNIKQLGKKRALLTEKVIAIDCKETTMMLRDLIAAIVAQQVNAYNTKSSVTDEEDTTHTPRRNYIDLLTETGKAGFENIYNEAKADIARATENALTFFEDGVIAVFQGDEQLTSLSQKVDLSRDESFTFLRLTFLAGSFW